MFSGITKRNTEPVVYGVTAKGPADLAGLLPGDEFVSLDGIATPTFISVLKYVRDKPDQKITAVVKRKGEQKTFIVVPERDKVPTPVLDDNFEATEELKIQGKLQMMPGKHLEKLSFSQSLSEAIALPYKMVQGLIGIVLVPSQFEDKMGGPMTILTATAGAVKEGVEVVILLSGLLSISLGILNLLPFPPFDGGQMMIAAAEMFRRGRRLGFKVQEKLFGAGTVLVLLLIVGVFWVDIKRFFFTDQGVQPIIKTIDSEAAASKK
jgi:regulator of sigma E protease